MATLKTDINLSIKLDMRSAIIDYLEKYSPKDLIRLIGTSIDPSPAIFPLSLSANGDDVERIQMVVLGVYLLDHWDELYEKAEKHFAEKIKEKT